MPPPCRSTPWRQRRPERSAFQPPTPSRPGGRLSFCPSPRLHPERPRCHKPDPSRVLGQPPAPMRALGTLAPLPGRTAALLDPASVAPATLSGLPSGILPSPAVFCAPVDSRGQKTDLRQHGVVSPRAGTAFTDSVPNPDSGREVPLQLQRRGTAPVGDSLRRFPEHLSCRARRCFEELLDPAASHVHLLWDRRKDTPATVLPPGVARKIPARAARQQAQKGAPAGAPPRGSRWPALTFRAWRGSPRSGP